MGVEPGEMRELLAAFPAIGDDWPSSISRLAVNNAFNDLLHGVGISEAECVEALGVPRSEALPIYQTWVRSVGWRSTGLR